MNFSDATIASVKGSDYRIHFWYMRKDDAINMMKNPDLKKVGHYKFFSLYITVGETIYYKRNRDTILNKAKYYYENNKEVLRKRARNKYRELSEEEKSIKREYGRNRYHNISEEKRQRLKKYPKKIKYCKANKSE